MTSTFKKILIFGVIIPVITCIVAVAAYTTFVLEIGSNRPTPSHVYAALTLYAYTPSTLTYDQVNYTFIYQEGQFQSFIYVNSSTRLGDSRRVALNATYPISYSSPYLYMKILAIGSDNLHGDYVKVLIEY